MFLLNLEGLQNIFCTFNINRIQSDGKETDRQKEKKRNIFMFVFVCMDSKQ